MSPARRRSAIALLAAVAAALFWLAPDPDMPEPVGAVEGPLQSDAPRFSGTRLPPLREWPAKTPAEPFPEVLPETADATRAAGRGGAAARSAEGETGAVDASLAARPVLPGLPFRYIGRLAAEGAGTVFLAARGETLSAEAGATLSGGWRLDTILPDRLEFTHLPTDTRQSLNISSP